MKSIVGLRELKSTKNNNFSRLLKIRMYFIFCFKKKAFRPGIKPWLFQSPMNSLNFLNFSHSFSLASRIQYYDLCPLWGFGQRCFAFFLCNCKKRLRSEYSTHLCKVRYPQIWIYIKITC